MLAVLLIVIIPLWDIIILLLSEANYLNLLFFLILRLLNSI